MNRALYALALGNFAVGTSAFTMAGLLNVLSADIGISVSAAGQLMTAYALAYALGSPFLTVATGKKARRWVVLFALALTLTGVLAMALAPNPAVLALARIVLACGAALFTPTAALIALTIAEPHRRVRALSLVIGGLTASQILGVPLGTFVGGALGWRWGVGLGAPVALAAMLMVWRSVPRDIPFHPPGLASFIGAFRDWRLCMVLALTLIATSGQNLVGVYVAPIITDYTGVGTRPLSVVLVMFGVAGLLGTLTGGLLTDRIGATRTLTVFLVLNIAGCLLIPLMGVSPWLATLVIMLWSFGAFGFNPAQQARVMARAPAALGGAAMSLNAAALYVGIGVGASAGGGLIAWRGTPALAPTALVILVVGMAFLSFSERKLGRTGPGARS